MSGSTGVTASSWGSSYPRYVFHYSMMQLSARRAALGRESAGASSTATSMASPSVTRFGSRHSSLTPGDAAALAARRASFDDGGAGGSRAATRQQVRRPGAHTGLRQESIVSISEVSEDGVREESSAEVFMDARSVLASSVTESCDLESRETPLLARAPSSLEPVRTHGTATTVRFAAFC